MPSKVYTNKDAKPAVLKNKILAVIGYGSQGHAHALNLKDSGFEVIVGLYPKSKSIELARRQGFKVLSTANAVKLADVILVAVPDLKQADIYRTEIEPNLTAGKTLIFAHGLSVHFKLITPLQNINVVLVAPKGPGHEVRAQYNEGRGVPALIAVYQGGKIAKEIALAWAYGIGSTRAGVIETTFQEETETDLFGEQTVLCGGISSLMKAGFETLVEAGYKPEMAYFECCHELKLITDLIVEGGISGMRSCISETAKYGDITRGNRVITKDTKKNMKKILGEIQSGKFVKDWIAEYKGGLKKYKKLLSDDERHPIEKVGQRLRSLMPWIAKRNIKGVQATNDVKL